MTPALQQGAQVVQLRHARAAARFVRSTLSIAVPVFLVATLITFLLGVVSGLDPAAGIAGDAASPEIIARIRADLGLDQPIALQYLQWMGQLLRGDLGTSWFNGISASELIAQRLPISLSIAGMALLMGLVFGTGLGLVAGVRSGTRIDRAITLFAAIVSSLPPFVVAFGLILVFSLWLGWLPSSGYVPFSEDPAGWLAAIGIPAVALSVDVVADLARQLRTGLVSALSENYVTGAVVRGLSRRRILFVHVLRNAAGPALTVVALRVPMLIGGAVVTEAIFNMPGMGKLAADSALRGDVPVVQGTLVVSIVLILACNLCVNVLLGVLQPAARRRS
ncbi:ABC transporter permease [Novosphingobium barchaimii LL02]|uniref:ABC transporter permease n=1 Tax=Novosphingobium barchaimii LL02 TaxID=1114963 RepID=A0A0J7XPH8_9SPHN|nr:ABC transporter permease [Novosphingobium barchaimii]KMS53572.1 ABC transporter permease [Novosphingobium barchaimii LL02]